MTLKRLHRSTRHNWFSSINLLCSASDSVYWQTVSIINCHIYDEWLNACNEAQIWTDQLHRSEHQTSAGKAPTHCVALPVNRRTGSSASGVWQNGDVINAGTAEFQSHLAPTPHPAHHTDKVSATTNIQTHSKGSMCELVETCRNILVYHTISNTHTHIRWYDGQSAILPGKPGLTPTHHVLLRQQKG